MFILTRARIACEFLSRFAYIEFVDKESVDNALKLDDSVFKGRQLKVGDLQMNVLIHAAED